jgi:hypothetical protein
MKLRAKLNEAGRTPDEFKARKAQIHDAFGKHGLFPSDITLHGVQWPTAGHWTFEVQPPDTCNLAELKRDLLAASADGVETDPDSN